VCAHYVSLACPQSGLIMWPLRGPFEPLKSENAHRRAQMPASHPRHLRAEWWNALYRPSSRYMIFADDGDSHPREGALARTRTLQIPTDTVWAADSPASHPNSPILGPSREPSQKPCPFDCKGQILTVKECRRLARAQKCHLARVRRCRLLRLRRAASGRVQLRADGLRQDFSPLTSMCAVLSNQMLLAPHTASSQVLLHAFLPPTGW